MSKIVNWIMAHRVTILTALALTFGLFPVIGVVGWVSWDHIVHVGRMFGEPNADLIPVSVDGMLIVSGLMGAVDRLRGYKTRGWAVAGLLIGSSATLAGNVASAWERGPGGMIVAAWPAVALILTVEMMFHPGRRLIAVAKAVLADITSVEPVEPPTPVVPPVPVIPVWAVTAPFLSDEVQGCEAPKPKRVRKTAPAKPKVTAVVDAEILPHRPRLNGRGDLIPVPVTEVAIIDHDLVRSAS